MSTSGGKERFCIRWHPDDESKFDGVAVFSEEWFALLNDYPPLEIRSIQGASGDNDLNDADLFPLPPGYNRTYHGTYLRKLPGILSIGLLSGGVDGLKKRSRLYCSGTNYMRFNRNYRAPSSPWTGFRYEPYFPRNDTDCMLILCNVTCKSANGYFKQAQSNTVVGPKFWNAPGRAIEMVVGHDGWVYYDRPEACEHQPEKVTCTAFRCGRVCPAGLVYCFSCLAPLPGSKERCITESLTKLDTADRDTRANAEQDWQDPTREPFAQLDAATLSEHAERHSQTISSRGANSDAGSILNGIRLQVRPRVRDSNPGQRGVANPSVHQSIQEQFDGWCFSLMWKVTHAKGCNVRPDLRYPA